MEPISLVEAKRHLREDGSDQDDLITMLIAAVRGQIDGANGWLNRALITQTWDLYLDQFPCGSGEIKLPLAPLQSVTAVNYYDADGIEQTVDAGDYTVDTVSSSGWVVPNADAPWPTPQVGINKVRVRYVAGYGAAGSDVPATIRAWMLLVIGSLYQQRESIVIGQPVAALPDHILHMLSTFRVY